MGMLCGVLALLALPGAVHPQARSEAMTAFGMLEMHQGTPAPDVTLLRLDGTPLATKDLRGKAVLVNFFATWCKPCLWEMPLMETLYQAYKDQGFVVLAISADQQGPDAIRSLVGEKKLTFPVALDPQHDAARRFNVTGIPTTILIGPDGTIKGIAHGPRKWDGKAARALITSLLPAANGGVAR
jgi:peroxiredoxin